MLVSCDLSFFIWRQEVVLLDNEISFNEAVIEEREQGIHEVQLQIGEVNEIFKDLAVLVHDQGAMIGKSSEAEKQKVKTCYCFDSNSQSS